MQDVNLIRTYAGTPHIGRAHGDAPLPMGVQKEFCVSPVNLLVGELCVEAVRWEHQRGLQIQQQA
jgi:hypothetical protein